MNAKRSSQIGRKIGSGLVVGSSSGRFGLACMGLYG